MNPPSRSGNIFRNIVILVLILTGAAMLLIVQYYKGIIKKKLPEMVATSSKHAYKCTLADVSINLLTRKVTFYELHIWFDSTSGTTAAGRERYQLALPRLVLSGISLQGLLSGNTLQCAAVVADRPVLRVMHLPDTAVVAGDTAASPRTKDPFIRSIRIQSIIVNRGQLQYTDPQQQASCKVTDVSLQLSDWEMQPGAPVADTTRILWARELKAQLSGMRYLKKGALYNFSLDTLLLHTGNRMVSFRGLAIQPAVSKKDFYKAVGHEKDLYRLAFGKVELRQFDLLQLIRTKKISADTMLLDSGNVTVYFSRLPQADPKSKMGKFPSQLLLKLPFTLSVPYTKISHGAAAYTEVSEETELPGALYFSALSGHIDNLSNDKAAIARHAHCILDLHGRFMKSSPVQARFDFLMTDSSGVFAVDAVLENIQEPQITDAALALGKVSVENIEVQQLKLHVAGDQHQAGGRFLFLYRDLAIGVKKVDKETKAVKDKPLLSFIANHLFLFPHNPMPGKEPRTAETHVVRDPHKSFFNLIWRNIFEGVKLTAVRNSDMIKMLGKKKKKK